MARKTIYRPFKGTGISAQTSTDFLISQLVFLLLIQTVHWRRYAGVKALARRLVGLASSDIVTPLLTRIWSKYAAQHNIANSATAQQDLLKISSIFPFNKTLLVSMLRACVYSDIDYRVIEFISRVAGRAVINDPDVKILLTFQRIKNGHFKGAAKDYLEVPYDAVKQDPLLAEIWRISAVHLIVKNDEDYFKNFDPARFVQLIRSEPQPNVVYGVMINLFNRFITGEKINESVNLMSKAEFSESPENFAIVYFFLTACGYVSQAETLEKCNPEFTKGRLHPLYVRGKLGPLGVHDEIRCVPRADMLRTIADDEKWFWRNAELERREIDIRISNERLAERLDHHDHVERQPHLLVAFFGQMRFPSFTLPEIRTWVEDNFEDTGDGAVITYGVSTWRELGSKILLPEDGFDYMINYFPDAVIGALKEMPLLRVSDAVNYFPGFSKLLLEFLPSVSGQVDRNEIKSLLKGDVYFDLNDEASFWSDVGASISDFARGERQILNQGRMIDRIGSVRDIIEQVERDKIPITHVLFIRPDLYKLSGRIRPYFDMFRHKRNWLVADQDVIAQFIEGVGDRYFLADRTAATHVLQMKDRVRDNFCEVPRNDLFCSRLSAHQMLGATLFENSIEVRTVPRSDIGWEVYRGDFKADDALAALEDDVSNLENFELRQSLLDALRASRN